MSESISYVGLDVHKAFIQVALLVPGAESPHEWRVENTATKVRGLIKKLRRSAPGPVRVCHEAGPRASAWRGS